ncbi:MAG: glycosyltransferase family 4 protein [Candidatus Peribacteraceae bacterium]
MRLLVVSYDDRPSIGGMGACMRQSVEQLRRTHSDLEVQVLSAGPTSDVPVPSFIRQRFKRPFGCPIFSLYLLFSLPGIVQRLKPDIVHVHAGSGGVFLLRALTTPVVVTAHHTYMQEVRHVFYDQPIKRVLKWLMSWLERRTYHIASLVLVVSADTRDALIGDYHVPGDRITILENAVTVSTSTSTTEKTDTIVSVGRLEKRKATQEMLVGFASLLQRRPTARLRLIGSNLLGEELHRLLSELGASHAVSLLGFLDDAQMERELAEATCVLVPSRLEGFGLIAAQSMMMGKCTIAADVPGLRTLIRHQETGFLFSIHDPSALADVIENVLTDSSLREQVGRAAALESNTRFALPAHTNTLHQIYLSLKKL